MQRILGIDVGSYSIKVAEIESSYRHFELVGFYELPVQYPKETVTTTSYNEALGKEGLISASLRRVMEDYNLSTDLVYASAPGQITALRVIELPFASFKKIDQTIEFEMENYVPLPLEELLIDYQILSSTKTDSRVLISYAKKSEFVKFLTAFANADLDPRFVGCEPVELSNLFKTGLVVPEGAYAILDLGHEKTNVVIFNGTQIQFARTIMMGGKDLTRAVAENLKVPFDEAEKMKAEIGQVGLAVEGADQLTRQVSEALKQPLGDLAIQIKQTLLAFQETRGEIVQALLLTGGTSRLAGLDQYLSSSLKKNVAPLDCLDFPSNRLSESDWCRSIAATALAVATRGVAGFGMKDIQFRRGEFAFKGEVKEVAGLARQGLIWGSVTALFVMGTFLISYASLKGSANKHSARLAAAAQEVMPEATKKTLSSPTAVLSSLTGRIAELEEKQKKIEEETNLSVLDVFREISATLPPRDKLVLDVDDLTIAARRVRVQGRTNSFEAVDQIKVALGRTPLFQNVAVDNVRKGVKEEVKFDLSFEVAAEAEKTPGEAPGGRGEEEEDGP